MGWQDRDYARATSGPTWSTIRPGRLIGGSIVTTLIVINVVIYVLAQLSTTAEHYFYELGAMQARAVLNGHIWRLFTAQYLHGGIGHLFINMLVLHFLGRSLERMWSTKKFFIVYTLCGLFGNIFYTILGARGVIDPLMPAVGASGCIYGLLGIVAVLFPQATVYIYFLFPMKIRTAAMIFAGISLLTILERGSNYGGEACHLSGLIFGVWWAMKGDAWWSRTQRSIPGFNKIRRSTPKGFKAKIVQKRADEETIDRILKKVYEGGVHSLTEKEKNDLKDATERRQQRDAKMGRIDRI